MTTRIKGVGVDSNTHEGTTRAISPHHLRQVFAAFPTGVVVIAALVGGVPVGMSANSFSSVSLDPPLVSVCLARSSRTAALLHTVEEWGISILGAHHAELSRGFARSRVDRFGDVRWSGYESGAIVLDGATAWLAVRVHRLIEAGDHDLVLLSVRDLDADHRREPLVFHRSNYRALAAESGNEREQGGR